MYRIVPSFTLGARQRGGVHRRTLYGTHTYTAGDWLLLCSIMQRAMQHYAALCSIMHAVAYHRRPHSSPRSAAVRHDCRRLVPEITPAKVVQHSRQRRRDAVIIPSSVRARASAQHVARQHSIHGRLVTEMCIWIREGKKDEAPPR